EEVLYDAEHFFDVYKEKTAYEIKTLQAALDAGAEMLILCDTNGGTLPEDVAERVAKVKQALPGVALGIHCRNASARYDQRHRRALWQRRPCQRRRESRAQARLRRAVAG